MKRICIVLVSMMLAVGWAGMAQAEEGHEGHSSGPKDSGMTAKEIVQKGIPSKNVSACKSCHGETGKSTSPAFPDLGGQYQSYLARALHEYRSKYRTSAIMNMQAKNLTDREIDALAEYFSNQTPVVGTPTLEE